MSDRAMSEEAMLASLRDMRLPSEAAGGMIADLAVTFGVAGLLAVLIAAGLRLLSQRRVSAPVASLKTRIAECAELPAPERRVALLYLLRAQDPIRYAELRGEIYHPGGGVDLATLEGEVKRFV
ncbi:hypothetical protein ROLI_042100 [Roseobacter fucihabitans]|uniref:Uncharacterized protein n=1 Tax=Roseobacter fucihabitans TaxID=1537242 RepID=A0ABZ2BYM7_9RHOB|nr:hypothetical protein [Roseobacter litoralis]MBC6965089.1 hypothetical protein [Roseobacter litoralis]